MQDIKKRLIVHTTFLAVIILTVSILQYLMNAYLYNLPRPVRTFTFLLFPHQVGWQLTQMLFYKTGNYHLVYFPLFSVLLYVLLQIGISEFRKTGNGIIITICFVLLIVSIVTAVPDIIRNYHAALEAYNDYVPPQTSGILDLIGNFGRPSKPSIVLLVLQFIILAGYLFWIGYILKLMRNYKKALVTERSSHQPHP